MPTHKTALTTAVRRTALATAACLAAALLTPAAAHAAPVPKQSSHASKADTQKQIAKSVLSMLNSERADNGLPALSMNADLIKSAHAHDLAMQKANTLSHQLPGESDLGTRVSQAGYTWTWAGENIGYNGDMSKQGVLDLESLMYNEKPPNDGHRQNILSTHYKDVGVDVLLDYTNDKVWLTTDFGHH